MHQNCNLEYDSVCGEDGIIIYRNVVGCFKSSTELILQDYSFFLHFISYFLS